MLTWSLSRLGMITDPAVVADLGYHLHSGLVLIAEGATGHDPVGRTVVVQVRIGCGKASISQFFGNGLLCIEVGAVALASLWRIRRSKKLGSAAAIESVTLHHRTVCLCCNAQ